MPRQFTDFDILQPGEYPPHEDYPVRRARPFLMILVLAGIAILTFACAFSRPLAKKSPASATPGPEATAETITEPSATPGPTVTPEMPAAVQTALAPPTPRP